jgi:hypothetical protein
VAGICARFFPFLIIGVASLQEISKVMNLLTPLADKSENSFLKKQFAFLVKDYRSMAVLRIVAGAGITVIVLFALRLHQMSNEDRLGMAKKPHAFRSAQDTVSIARFMVPYTDDSIKQSNSSDTPRFTGTLILLNKELSKLCFYNLVADSSVKIHPPVAGANGTSSQVALSGVSALSSAVLSVLALNSEALGSGNLTSGLGSMGSISPVFFLASAGLAVSAGNSMSASSRQGDTAAKQSVVESFKAVREQCDNISTNLGSFFFLRNTARLDLSNWLEENFYRYVRDHAEVAGKRALAANDYILAELLSMGQITKREVDIFSYLEYQRNRSQSPMGDMANQVQTTLGAVRQQRSLLQSKLHK